MWLCICSSSQFEETFENAQRRKIEQMQPVWLCIRWCKPFENTFENPQRRKAKQMQSVWLCIPDSLRTHSKTHSGEKPNKRNQCDYASSRATHLRRHLNTHSEDIWTHTAENNKRCVFLHPLDCRRWRHTIWFKQIKPGVAILTAYMYKWFEYAWTF